MVRTVHLFVRRRRRVWTNSWHWAPFTLLMLFWPSLTEGFRGQCYGSALECFHLRCLPSLLLTLELATSYGLMDCPSTEGRNASYPTLYPLPFGIVAVAPCIFACTSYDTMSLNRLTWCHSAHQHLVYGDTSSLILHLGYLLAMITKEMLLSRDYVEDPIQVNKTSMRNSTGGFQPT